MNEDSQNDVVNYLLNLLMQHQQGDTVFKHVMQQKAVELGIIKFIEEVARPLGIAIGEMWYRGEMNIFIERYYSTQLTELLNDLIIQNDIQRNANQPRILLGTLTGEKHILGLSIWRRHFYAHKGHFASIWGRNYPFLNSLMLWNILKST